MTNPKVTVLMSVYNGEKYLRQAVDSILNQTFKDFEFLIINDDSTDRTVQILQSYHDPRIKIINNEKNIGLTKSLNRGLKLARGKYIARMDADDISLPKRLEKQVNFMDNNPEIGIAGSWIKNIGEQARITKCLSDPEEIKANLFFNNSLSHSSVVIRKSLIKKYNLYYDSNFRYAQDYELWTRASKYLQISNIKEPLLLYRVHKKNLTIIHRDIQEKKTGIVRINQLKNLNINPSKEEIIIHQSVNKPSYYKREVFIDKVEAWLIKLKKQNKKIKFYPEKPFLKFLSLRWLVICRANTEGFWAWRRFWHSPLSHDIKTSQYQQLIRFFIKCLLKRCKLYKLYKSVFFGKLHYKEITSHKNY